MAAKLPAALETLIEELGRLPGVGRRTAERYAYQLLRREPAQSTRLAHALEGLHAGVGYCQKTFCLVEADQTVSPLYSDPKRNKQQVAVVEDPLDVIAIEKTAQYSGTYHVLGGLLSPIDGVGPDQIRIKELSQRIADDNVEEVILATNASVEGESTALYIQNELKSANVKVSRLARGLPVGVDLEYADQVTLGRALAGRQTVE